MSTMSRLSAGILSARPVPTRAIALVGVSAAAVAFLVARYDIGLVLLAGILLGVSALMFAKPEQATLTILFVLYANLSVVAIRFHNVPEVVAASIFVFLGIPLTNYLLILRQKIVINRIMLLMLIYFAVALASLLLAKNPLYSVDRLLSYTVEGIVLYFLFVNTVRTSATLRKAIWVLLLAGSFMGSISIYQESTHKYDDPLWGLAQVKSTEISAAEDEDTGGKTGRQRLAGPVGSKNRYAQIMVVLLPMALFRIRGERSRALRLLAAASCIPIMVGALLTFSRGAGITIGMILVLMTLLGYIRPRRFLVYSLGAALVVVLFVPDYMYRISTVVGVERVFSGKVREADASIRGRATENLAVLHIFLDHPVMGVGAGQSSLYTTEYGNKFGFRKLEGNRRGHDMYLEELADTGVIGFVSFMAIVLVTLRQLTKARRRWVRARPDFANLAATFWFSIVAYLGTAVFLHLSYQRYYWVLLALAGAALEIFRSEGADEYAREAGCIESPKLVLRQPLGLANGIK